MVKVWHVGGEDVYMRIPLLRQLADRGFAVGAVGSGCESRFADAGIEYHDITLERGLNPTSDLRGLRSLTSLVRTHAPAIAHGFDTKPSILTPLAARGNGSTLAVRTINGMGNLFSEDTLATRLLRPGYRLAQRAIRDLAAHVIFQNEDDLAYFRRHLLVNHASSSLIRGSGIDAAALAVPVRPQLVTAFREEFGLRAAWPTVALVARLVRNKGILEFLTAARALRQRGIEANFLLVGPIDSEGSQAVERSMLDAYADIVTVTGPRVDIPTVLAATDLFVFPSYYREGVPRALLEAAAVGLPLVASDMPGCRDVVVDGDNGCLVPTRDARALAGVIRSMLGDLSSWTARAKLKSADIVSRFGLDRVADEHAFLYGKLLDRGART